MKYIKTYESALEPETFSGKEGFLVFLKLANKLDNVFLKNKHYLNFKDYILFFFTDRISDNGELEYQLSVLSSLEYGYKVIKEKLDEKLFFYFGVKQNMLVYGFCNEDQDVYQIGEFEISTKYFRSLTKLNCLSNIHLSLKEINLNSLIFLNKIRPEFKNFENGKVDILNDRVIRLEADRNIVPYDDNQLNRHLDYWLEQQPWQRKVYSYIGQDEDKVKFYLKTKIER